MIGLLVCMYKLAVKEKLWQAGLHLFVHGKYLKEEELISKGDISFCELYAITDHSVKAIEY